MVSGLIAGTIFMSQTAEQELNLLASHSCTFITLIIKPTHNG